MSSASPPRVLRLLARAKRLWSAVLPLALIALALAPATSVGAPYIAAESAGVPPGPGAAHEDPNTQLYGVSCPSGGSCFAVGLYDDEAGAPVRMLTTESDGAWSSEALAGSVAESFRSLPAIACPAGGGCIEAGSLLGRAGGAAEGVSWPLIVSEANGHGSEASDLTIAPPEVDPEGKPSGGFEAISCPIAGACVAVGSYTNAGGESLPMAAVEVGGAWPALATELPTLSGGAPYQVRGVSCSGANACTAIGLGGKPPQEVGYAAELDASGWQPAEEVPAPAAGEPSAFEGVSCVAAGACSAAGRAGYGLNEEATVATRSGGAWRSALVDGGGRSLLESALNAIACPAAGDCVAVGSGQEGAILAGEHEGAWSPIEPIEAPFGGRYPLIASVSCATSAQCTAVGTYSPEGGGIGAVSVTIVPEPQALAITTAILPAATVGTPYEAQLGAVGGSGEYSWSVSGGVLPAGLALNKATGAISGTPTVARSATFTVKLTDPGPPAEQVTRRLEIEVAPAASPAKAEVLPAQSQALPAKAPTASAGSVAARASAPVASLAILASAPARRGRVAKLRLACAQARCAGTLTVSAIVTVRVHSNGSALRRHVRVVLARGRCSLRAGTRRTLTLRLTARGRRLVDRRVRRRRLPLLVRVAAKLAGGGSRVDSMMWG